GPRGAQPPLFGRPFSRDVQRRYAGGFQPGGALQQQGRLADAGFPPTSTTEPGTMPPPSTKSNSARPVLHLGSAPLVRADRRTGGLPDVCRACLTARPPVRPTASSTSVFHAPQPSQRPAHFGCSAPHS